MKLEIPEAWRTNLPILCLASLFFFHFAVNCFVILDDELPFSNDPSYVYCESIRLYGFIPRDFSMEALSEFYRVIQLMDKGQIIALAALPMYGLFGVNQASAMMVNNIFLLVLLASVYGLGKHFGSKKAGLVAAVICSFLPPLYASSRTFVPIFALTSMVTLDIFLLVKTDAFRSRGYSILLGIAIGLSFITKPVFLLYIFVPLLSSLFFFVRARLFMNRRVVINLLLALAIASVFVLPGAESDSGQKTYIFVKFQLAFQKIKLYLDRQTLGRIVDTVRFNTFSFMFSPTYLYALLLSSFFFFFSEQRGKAFLVNCIWFPFVFLWMYCDPQYFQFVQETTPCLPFFGLIIALGICRIREVFAKLHLNRLLGPGRSIFSVENTAIVLVISLGLLQYVKTNFVYEGDPRRSPVYYGFGLGYDQINFIGRLHSYKIGYAPKEVVDLIYREAPPRKMSIFVFREDHFWWALKNEVFIKEYVDGIDVPTFHHCREQKRPFIDSWLDTEGLFEMMRNSDFVILENGETQFWPRYDKVLGKDLGESFRLWEEERGKHFTLLTRLNDSFYNEVEIFQNKRSDLSFSTEGKTYVDEHKTIVENIYFLSEPEKSSP